MSIRFTTNESRHEHVLAHLSMVDTTFIPPLSQRVSLNDYAAKLFACSVREEAWLDDVLVGLVAFYCNEAARGTFISNVSVLPDRQGTGLGTRLLRQALDRARAMGMHRVNLVLHPDNAVAMALYTRHGFKPDAMDSTQLSMTLELPTS